MDLTILGLSKKMYWSLLGEVLVPSFLETKSHMTHDLGFLLGKHIWALVYWIDSFYLTHGWKSFIFDIF